MIEPHSAQLGASSWILNATFVAPSESVIVEPFVLPLAALLWPLPLAMTASSDVGAGEEEITRATSATPVSEPAFGIGCSTVDSARGAASTANAAFGLSVLSVVGSADPPVVGEVDPPSVLGAAPVAWGPGEPNAGG